MELKTIAVIGSGIMGNGIAQLAASAGYRVNMHDTSPEALDNALRVIKDSLSRFVRKGKLSDTDAAQIAERVNPDLELRSAIREADYVIEAVPEDMDLKCRVFQEVDAAVPDHAIMASNTSQYSITQIAAATKRPAQVIGAHFFNPPVLMGLVEVVRGLETSEETVATTIDLAKRMGKEVVICRDSQGFITSRLINLWCNEAERIVEEGVATAEDVDKACRLAFNHPMGPMQITDFSGLDTRLNASLAMEATLGERFKPTQSLRRLVNAGHLGRKSGRGFYDYTGE
ncbi:MAG: 3-hydroxyacyl-CoA dehydrogenase family protein [Desulfomonilaceae bacterium]|nr:3-hydroxyacyl-CoA dehydrogenase family protein [Desulfomonilaceae bacterium]